MKLALGNKSKDIAKTKEIDGELYLFCHTNGEKDLYVSMEGLKIPKRKCERCGYNGSALEEHHIHGRRNSSKTIILCANCHREYHIENGYNMEGK